MGAHEEPAAHRDRRAFPSFFFGRVLRVADRRRRLLILLHRRRHRRRSRAQLTSITAETLEILSNREIIAINQDPVVGTGLTPFRWGRNVRPTLPLTPRDERATGWLAGWLTYWLTYVLAGWLIGWVRARAARLDERLYVPGAVLERALAERDRVHARA